MLTNEIIMISDGDGDTCASDVSNEAKCAMEYNEQLTRQNTVKDTDQLTERSHWQCGLETVYTKYRKCDSFHHWRALFMHRNCSYHGGSAHVLHCSVQNNPREFKMKAALESKRNAYFSHMRKLLTKWKNTRSLYMPVRRPWIHKSLLNEEDMKRKQKILSKLSLNDEENVHFAEMLQKFSNIHLSQSVRLRMSQNVRDCAEEQLLENLQLKAEEKHRISKAEEEDRVSGKNDQKDIIKGKIIPESEEQLKLVKLTPQMEERVSKAFASGPPDEVLVTAFSQQIRITLHDIQTLKENNWLNDQVINFYFNLIMERGELKNYPSVFGFSTFFYPKLATSGYASIRKWTKKVDIFTYDLLIFPVHRGIQWCLAVINMKKKTISYYDSMDGVNTKCLRNLLKYLEEESIDKKKQSFSTSDWIIINVQDKPRQTSCSDCGTFTCTYAEFICREAELKFTQSDMPYFRHKMAYEILTKKLLC